MWGAMVVILSVFGGISMLVATVATVILVGVGRITIPGSAEHKLRMARASVEELDFERQRLLLADQVRRISEHNYQQAIAEKSSNE